MDKEFQMAYKKRKRRSMLLDRTRDGEVIEAALSRGDSGQKASSYAKGDEGSQNSHPETQSKSDAKIKTGSKRGRKPRQNNPSGGDAGEAKRRDYSGRRSARELGISWVGSRCEVAPSKAHVLVGKNYVDSGYVFQCTYCGKVKWLPASFDLCNKMNKLMQVYGYDTGYQMMLDEHPTARRLLSKIQDIYYLRRSLPPDEFGLAVAAVVLDREYPYDIEITEEELL
jgi:hypothetical protein